jgi:hypothetical protein
MSKYITSGTPTSIITQIGLIAHTITHRNIRNIMCIVTCLLVVEIELLERVDNKPLQS